MLLFEHKHLHSYDAPSSMQTEILSSTGFLIDHIFKVNISDERCSDDRLLTDYQFEIRNNKHL